MSKAKELVGKRFGRLTVMERAENYTTTKGQVHRAWLCVCDCGNRRIVRASSLISGHTKSCGCLQVESRVEQATKHGKSECRLYDVWHGMKQRCGNPLNKNYAGYGRRGIKVCDEWLNSFQAFYDWATANGYREGLSLDRIDNDKGYSPDNCRWTTMKEQANNRRKKRKITEYLDNGVQK